MILLITTIVLGLTAGVFYCWSVSVTRGLAPLPDKEYITFFQSLNREIQNPLFFLCFFGTMFLLPISTWQSYGQTVPLRFWLLLGASAIYIIGVVAITMVGNVPMNESMDAFNTASATAKEIADKRISHEAPWNFLNNIRTICCVICLALTVLACMIQEDAKVIDFN